MNDNVLLETISLTKRYKDVTALKDFSVKLKSNKIYGLLGRNGAGKTTLLDTVTSRIFRTAEMSGFSGRMQRKISKYCLSFAICLKKLLHTNHGVSDILKVSAMFYENFDMGYADQLCVRFGLDKRKIQDPLKRV